MTWLRASDRGWVAGAAWAEASEVACNGGTAGAGLLGARGPPQRQRRLPLPSARVGVIGLFPGYGLEPRRASDPAAAVGAPARGRAGPGPASWQEPPGSRASSLSDLPVGRQPEILPEQRPARPSQQSSAAPRAGVQALQRGLASVSCTPVCPHPRLRSCQASPRPPPHPAPSPPTHTQVLEQAGLQRAHTRTRCAHMPPTGGPRGRAAAAEAWSAPGGLALAPPGSGLVSFRRPRAGLPLALSGGSWGGMSQLGVHTRWPCLREPTLVTDPPAGPPPPAAPRGWCVQAWDPVAPPTRSPLARKLNLNPPDTHSLNAYTF